METLVVKKEICLWNKNAPGSNQVQIGYFKYKGHGYGRMVIIPSVICLSMHSKYDVSISSGSNKMAKVTVFLPQTDKQTHTHIQTDRQAGQKLDAQNSVTGAKVNNQE